MVPPHERSGVGSFWWRDILSLSTNFFMIASCLVQKGDTIAFWKDFWDLGVLKWKYLSFFPSPEEKIFQYNNFNFGMPSDPSFCLYPSKPMSNLRQSGWIFSC
jgi:hypothetical protein